MGITKELISFRQQYGIGIIFFIGLFPAGIELNMLSGLQTPPIVGRVPFNWRFD